MMEIIKQGLELGKVNAKQAGKLAELLVSLPDLRLKELWTPALPWEEAIIVFQIPRYDRMKKDIPHGDMRALYEYMESTTYREDGYISSEVFFNEEEDEPCLVYKTISGREIHLKACEGGYKVHFYFDELGSNLFAEQVASDVSRYLGEHRMLYFTLA